jgi:DNA repair photolyase
MSTGETANFQEGQHGCPIGCQYCVITEVDSRRDAWNESTILGINKAVTILNPPPNLGNEQAVEEFYNFPVELLRGDMVGFNGISDPFWPKYRKELEWFLANVPQEAKLVTCVTKWNIPDKILDRLAEIPNFRLIVSMTGLDQLERTSTQRRLDVLRRAKEKGVPAFPIVHPYIPGMSDLSFLPELKAMGYDDIDIKGLRYNPNTMNAWMPTTTQAYFADSNENEVLVDDGWSELVALSGLQQMSLKRWYRRDFDMLTPRLTHEEAIEMVSKIVSRANITSSDTDEAVFQAAIERRL